MKHFIGPPPPDMSSTLMSFFLPSIIFSTLLISLQCTAAFSSSPANINVEHDAHALLALKNGFQFPEPTLSTWNNHSSNSSSSILDDVCSSWTGVRCLDGRVISLDLTDFNLRGSVSPAIYALDSLIHLSLAGNNLTGNIQLSDLSTSLRFLNISNNQFNGGLEWKKGNDSTGGVVSPDLEVFDVYDNNFTDLLPVNGLLELRKLKHLDLGGNYFYGEIPAEYGMLSDRLEYLSLQGNDLRGRIPSELGNLTSLKELYLGYYNSWEGGIPAELGNLVNLVLLDISNCELLDGTVPPQLGNLSLLKSLFLHANLLSGPIPKEFGNLTGLINLDLSNNALTGEIPSELSSLKQLKLFNLFMNKLHGSIPDYVAREFPDLEVLQLWKNNFTGMIPQDLGKNSGKLEIVDLSSNKLTGTIPSGLCDSKKLNILILLRNFLFGPIPDGLGMCFSLVRVRLGQNYLNGSIPSGLIYLPQLNLLELQDNDLTGSLAENPTSGDYNDGATAATSVLKLVQLDLSNNHLSGPLPSSISNLSSLQFLLLGGNQFSGPIPSSSLGKLEQAVKIDLSKNNISGWIPPAFGACTHLTYLDLSQNNLSGTIPPQISRIRILNYLNLSRNHLEGGIPDAIGSMKSLTNADFSFNNLSGELPETGQLSVFNASSFAGNSQLCGSLINNPCNLSTLMPDSSGGGGSGAGKAGNAGEFRLIFALGFLICSLVFTAVAVAKAKSFKKGGPGSGSWKMTTFGKVEFRVSDVLECMRDGNVIGRGGAGIVYRGKLPNGMEIAVKKLLSCGPSPSSSHDDHGFRAEIQTLGNIRHRNIVRLLAFCSNKQTNVLVFEYMRNGSLGEALHNGKVVNKGGIFLGWNLRYKIAIEAAKGLCYLHHDCSPLIVHRDVKSNNILLDSNFEAHVADFGLAKFLVDGGASECMSAIAGSYGYIAPEYAYTLRVDEKSDVYSFGVVLLELLTGHRPVGDFGEGVDIVQWSKSTTRCRKEDVYCVIDQRLMAHVPQEEAMHFFFIAMLCVQDNSVERPTMRDVVQMLTEFQDLRHPHHKSQDQDHLQSPSSSAAVVNQKSNCSRKEEKEQPTTKLNSRDHLLV